MIPISVVIPTYNRVDRLGLVLEGLESQTLSLENFEVIVVSDGSTDGTVDYLNYYRPPYRFRPVFQENQGVAAARNRGIETASGKLVVFLDDDTVPVRRFLEEHWGVHLKQGRAAVATGPMLLPLESQMLPWVRWDHARLQEQYESMLAGEWQPSARQFYTANASLERSLLLQAGCFDPQLKRAEDVELAYRLANHGARFFFNPDAVVYHYAIRSLRAWLSIAYAYGQNDVVFTQQKGSDWLLPTLFREYRQRHPFVQALTWLCLGRKPLSQRAVQLLELVVQAGSRMKAEKITFMALSGMYNLRYYEGIADQLGGRSRFFQLSA